MEKIRKYAFPIAVFCISIPLLFLCRVLIPGLDFDNNSILYFSFLNQAGCYSIGFSLYDLSKTGYESVSTPFLKGIAALIASVALFYSGWAYSFILIPTVFGVCVLYFFVFAKKKSPLLTGCLFERAVSAFGQNSFCIFLTHTFVVYDAVYIERKVVHHFAPEFPDTLLYLISLPFIFILVYYLGKLFSVLMKTIRKYLCRILRKPCQGV